VGAASGIRAGVPVLELEAAINHSPFFTPGWGEEGCASSFEGLMQEGNPFKRM
jgi:hypothetical protein